MAVWAPAHILIPQPGPLPCRCTDRCHDVFTIFLARAINPSSSRHCARPRHSCGQYHVHHLHIRCMVACMASRAMDCHAWWNLRQRSVPQPCPYAQLHRSSLKMQSHQLKLLLGKYQVPPHWAAGHRLAGKNHGVLGQHDPP